MIGDLFSTFGWLAIGLAFFGGGGAVKPMPASTPPPSETDPDVQAKRAARRYRSGLESGFSSTIATSPLGAQGSQQGSANVSKLGG